MNLTQQIKEKAYDLGFDLIGVAPARAAPHAAAYQQWLAKGYQAGMGWLGRDPARRSEPRLVVPGAQSVIVIGLSYFVANPPAKLWNDPLRGRIARYAWGLDYHDVMLPKLRELGEFVDQVAVGIYGRKPSQRSYVDTGPVLERSFGAQAGIGFVGKNTLLISPRLGSYFFLGEILIDLDLDYDPPAAKQGAEISFLPTVDSPVGAYGYKPNSAPLALSQGEGKLPSPPLGGTEGGLVAIDSQQTGVYSRKQYSPSKTATCGQCTRCLTVCPTHAFPAPYILDSNRCISYLTIEHKGEIDHALRPLLGNWIYGCDACQEICPWVRRYSQPTRADFLRYDAEQFVPSLIELMALDDAGFRRRFKGSPIKRTKRRGLLRNVAIALGNAGDPAALPVLHAATQDDEPLIRSHAAWAIEAIGE